MIDFLELFGWLIPITIAVFLVQYWGYYLIALFVIYFVTVRTLELISVSNLKNKAVFITGCDSGFGYGLSLKCLRAGMPVFSACFDDNGRKRLEQEASKIPNGKDLLKTLKLNVCNGESVLEANEFVESNLGSNQLWAIVNNAGMGDLRGWDDWQTPADYQRLWDVNTLGVIRVTHAFKHLLKQSKGRIVNVGSICSKLPMPAIVPYSVSKMAVAAYTDGLRAEISQWGIKVCMLEPGFFQTPQANPNASMDDAAKVWNRLPKTIKEEYGDEYFRWSQRAITEYLEYKCKPGAEMVVDAYFNAIVSMFPRCRYQIGYDSIFQFNTLSYLPCRIQDIIFRLYWKFVAKPPPFKSKLQ